MPSVCRAHRRRDRAFVSGTEVGKRSVYKSRGLSAKPHYVTTDFSDWVECNIIFHSERRQPGLLCFGQADDKCGSGFTEQALRCRLVFLQSDAYAEVSG